MTYQDTIRKVREIIEELRPNIQMDGGELQFVHYEDGVVYVRLHGFSAYDTIQHIKNDIKQILREYVSELQEVMIVTSLE